MQRGTRDQYEQIIFKIKMLEPCFKFENDKKRINYKDKCKLVYIRRSIQS